MRSVVHFEIPADDVARAKEFYSSIFGWQLQDMPEMDYTIVKTTETDEQTREDRGSDDRHREPVSTSRLAS
jgi:uncharacterized protein